MPQRFQTPSVVSASSAKTVTGQTTAVAVEHPETRTLAVGVDVTAVSGTSPTCTFSVEWSLDGGTTWFQGDPADAFTALTAAGKKAKSFTVKAPHYRLVWTIGGTTPSFTFSASTVGLY